MSRIALSKLDDLSPTASEFVTRRGQLNVFRLLAGAPEVFDGWIRMVDAQLNSTTISGRLSELVILRVAHLQRSRYELAQHADVARQGGISESEIAAVTSDGPVTGFAPAEATVLSFVTELVTTRTVSAESFAAADAQLGTAAVTELLMLVSLYYGLALVLNASDVEIDRTDRLEVRR
ncbi:carboxymuconolactone decarboxylase family protein [Rhodococcus sp. ACT016]|uniref:carboxymuconolactone decarboxylase family protein n=1 Tax=Rhodococcus sp. ACT016 TaxID=3134808 RepID=UPI003D276E96